MESTARPEVCECHDLPENPDVHTIYRLLPKNEDASYYHERTDRNIGWITREEQELVRRSTIGIAGCGGMGGQLAEKFLRLGIGEIRIADNEVFDTSNINRQFAATRSTIGKSKAFETARLLRAVSDDFTLVVYPEGIHPQSVDQFLAGCDVVCDEIEFWAAGSRILLHERARMHGISAFCCDTVGFGTRLFFFTPRSATMEECLDFTYEEARTLQESMRSKRASRREVLRVMQNVWRGLLTEYPEYCPEDPVFKNIAASEKRLFDEGKGPILATNPPMAAGLLADRVLLYLLRNSGVKRTIAEVPEMPGYLYFDAARMEAKIVRERWW